MDLNDLKQVIELFSRSNVDKFELQMEGINLKMGKRRDEVIAAPLPVAPQPVAAKTVEPNESSEEPGMVTIKSPIVGTFYRAPNPEAEPFIKVGDRVRSGQTLCIVEAMKLMNEIPAEEDCLIERILVENGQGVEFGQPLFAVKTI